MARILIIDDDEMLLSAWSRLFGLSGHNVVATADGPHGVKLFSEGLTDLVILDLGLPSMSGIEVLKELRRIKGDALVIMATGYMSAADAEEAKKQGAFAFLDKTSPLDELTRTVDAALDQQKKGTAGGL